MSGGRWLRFGTLRTLLNREDSAPMRTHADRQSQTPSTAASRPLHARCESCLVALATVSAALLATLFVLSPSAHAAQAPPAAAPAAQSTGSPRTKPDPAQPAAPPAQNQSAQSQTNPDQPHPDWPAKDHPIPATVSWDSHGLLVDASNSSLDQILHEISLRTGMKIEGMGADERIFGVYGPGPVYDVLAQLLDGSSYNVLMIGDQGQGTPRRIVLSARVAAGPQPAANNTPSQSAEEETPPEPEQPEQPQQPPQVPIARPGDNNAPPTPVRTPQQILEEIQQRQRMEQQQNPQN